MLRRAILVRDSLRRETGRKAGLLPGVHVERGDLGNHLHAAQIRRGEDTVDLRYCRLELLDRESVVRLSNFNKRISSNTRIELFELDEGFQPYQRPLR